jgi:hypothetical protein
MHMRLLLKASTLSACSLLAAVVGLAPTPVRGIALPATEIATAAPSSAALPHRPTLEERFSAANVSHDGRLTRSQAEGSGWMRIAKHFGEIDTAARGYVTLDDIHNFNRMRRQRHTGSAG